MPARRLVRVEARPARLRWSPVDERLRELERRWRTTPILETHLAWSGERVREDAPFQAPGHRETDRADDFEADREERLWTVRRAGPGRAVVSAGSSVG